MSKPFKGLHVSFQAPESQRLHLGKNLLEDARQLAELKVENDDVLALTYQQAGMSAAKLSMPQQWHSSQ